MSDKSGVAEQVLALPKGGGAIAGVGETFAPDPQSGTAGFRVPIALPAGRNGLTPALELVYSSAQGNGAFGLGWSPSIPRISRQTSHGIPRYDERDRFVYVGDDELVPIEADATHTRYQPRVEAEFARITHYHDAANDYWEVRQRTGRVDVFGTPGTRGADPAAVADPADPRRVFAWQLSLTTDTFGNRIEYAYRRDAGQLYLETVRWADHDAGATLAFLYRVDLAYEPRPDPLSNARAGFELRTALRCTRIDVACDPGVPTPIRSYELAYVDQRRGAPINAASLLAEVQLVGDDGMNREAFPAIAFDYTQFEPARREVTRVRGAELPPRSLADPQYELADLFGRGLPDVFQLTDDGCRYWRNLGNGELDRPRSMPLAPAGFSLGRPEVQLLDADGDGRIDLVVDTPATSGFFPLGRDGWSRERFHSYAVAPTFPLGDPEVKLVDLDGDGVIDALRTGEQLECFFNDPTRGWGATRVVERRHDQRFPDLTFSDSRIKLADMTGDGLQDLVEIHDGSIEYWPSLGRGSFGARVVMRHAPRLPEDYDPRRLLLGDIDGDGVADLVYVDDARVTVWINQAGNAWSEPVTIHGTPRVVEMDAVRLVDLMGSGVQGILWSRDATASGAPHLFFLDLCGGRKPYLVAQMANGLGAITRVTYGTSTEFALADERRGAPWLTTLPFPVQVVKRVEVIDAISGGKRTTEYSYHHGYWDGVERELRGFARVDRRDSETFTAFHDGGASVLPIAPESFAPPTELRTWFHVGPVGSRDDWRELDLTNEMWGGDPAALQRPPDMGALLQHLPRADRRDLLRALQRMPLRTELYAIDGSLRQARPYQVIEHLHGVREESPPAVGVPRRRIFFAHQLAERTTDWERGDEPHHRFRFSDGYDAYGQVTREVAIAVPRGRDFRVAAAPGDPYLAVLELTEYAQRDDAQRFIVDRVARKTGYELANDGSLSLLEQLAAARAGTSARRVSAQTASFYDGAAFTGLPWGSLGDHGVASRIEMLVIPDGAASVPPYFDAAPSWTSDYPPAFRAAIAAGAGYVHRAAAGGFEAGYFAATKQCRYDFQSAGSGRGVVLAERDAIGGETTFGPDAYQLLVATLTDPLGLVTQIDHDYRVQQPSLVTDPNGNRTMVTYTPLGMVATSVRSGKVGAAEGDTAAQPTARFTYDLTAFIDRGVPTSVQAMRRVFYVNDALAPAAIKDDTVSSVEFSDGFGRSIQLRTLAEDVIFDDATSLGLSPDPSVAPGPAIGKARAANGSPNVTVSAWKVFDNKGRVVEEHQPFFSAGYDFEPNARRGAITRSYYDPLGRKTRIVNPDGSEQRVFFGVPAALDDPDRSTPTPWESYTYDANDNAGRTHPATSGAWSSHWNTPTSVVFDALGRVIASTERNGATAAAWHTTRSTYDLRGNLLTVIDASARTALTRTYDLADRVLARDQLDAGLHTTSYDAAGRIVEQRDARGALTLRAYDAAGRPTFVWARDSASEPVTLREQTTYGESVPGAAAANLLGHTYQVFDESGVVTFAAYDFTGKVASKQRQVIADGVLDATFRVDWTTPPPLDPSRYDTDFHYDALDAVRIVTAPADTSGHRAQIVADYNRAAALERLAIDGQVFLDRAVYDARRQHVLVAYGNGVMIRQAFDDVVFRLRRVRAERFTGAGTTYLPQGTPLHVVAHDFDLVGNITTITNTTPGCGLPASPDRLVRQLTYDPRYRLVQATGRECDQPVSVPPWLDTPLCQDVTATRAYTEIYTYDAIGALASLQHAAGPAGSFTRTFTPYGDGNRVQTMSVGGTPYAYTYDAAGQLATEDASRALTWDHAGRLRSFTTSAGASATTTVFLYDRNGQRVKKLVRKPNGSIERITYVDGIFEHELAPTGELCTINVHDRGRVLASSRTGALPDGEPAVLYHVSDHLGSHHVVLDGAGAFLNREEYTPYGETSFGSYARKRWRFTGKERDDSTGLSYFGARYYAPWLGRWTSTDPAATGTGPDLYEYASGNPLVLIDPDGGKPKAWSGAEHGTIDHVAPVPGGGTLTVGHELRLPGKHPLETLTIYHAYQGADYRKVRFVQFVWAEVLGPDQRPFSGAFHATGSHPLPFTIDAGHPSWIVDDAFAARKKLAADAGHPHLKITEFMDQPAFKSFPSGGSSYRLFNKDQVKLTGDAPGLSRGSYDPEHHRYNQGVFESLAAHEESLTLRLHFETYLIRDNKPVVVVPWVEETTVTHKPGGPELGSTATTTTVGEPQPATHFQELELRALENQHRNSKLLPH